MPLVPSYRGSVSVKKDEEETVKYWQEYDLVRGVPTLRMRSHGTLLERFGHQGAPMPGEKGHRPAPQATEGALDGRTVAEVAGTMFDAAYDLLDSGDLPLLIQPEWEADWTGFVDEERYHTPQHELDAEMEELAELVGVPYRGLDGNPAPLQARSDLAHNMLRLAQQVRYGDVLNSKYLTESGEWADEFKDEYFQADHIPRWAAVASVEDRLTGKVKNRLVLVPKKEAFAFVKKHHSTLGEGHKLPPGTMYAIGIKRGRRLVAVALAGHPTGGAMKRAATPRSTVELTRVASDGTTKNAASMLTARILDILERSKRDVRAPSLFITYSLLTESGTTYRALKDKGLRPVALTRPKKKMTGQRKGGKGLAAQPKIRWEAGEDAREADWSLLDLTKTKPEVGQVDLLELAAERLRASRLRRKKGN